MCGKPMRMKEMSKILSTPFWHSLQSLPKQVIILEICTAPSSEAPANEPVHTSALASGGQSVNVSMTGVKGGGKRASGSASVGRIAKVPMTVGQDGTGPAAEKKLKMDLRLAYKVIADATDWLNNTCAGFAQPGEIRSYVQQRWPKYYEIEPVMAERPNTRHLLRMKRAINRSM
eukprot:IDg10604t1